MSLAPIFLDGFEQYCSAASTSVAFPATTLWDSTSGTVGTNFGRFGGIGGSPNATGLIKTVSASTVTFGIAFGVALTTTARLTMIVFSDSAGTAQAAITANVDGSISLYRGNVSTLLATSAAGVLLATGTNHHFEAQLNVDPSAGTIDVWVDGVCVLSSNALNTRGSSVVGSGVAKVQLTANNASGASNYDDVVMYDAGSRTGSSGAGTPASSTFEHYGDKRVQTLFPSGAGTGNVGTFTQTGGTGGSPYTAVNDRPADGNTSYVADATPGDIISFALDDLASGTTGVTAVAMVAQYEKDDATARTCAAGIRDSSTNAFGTTRGAPGAYAYTQDIRTLDATGSALTPTNVNAMELLFKVVS